MSKLIFGCGYLGRRVANKWLEKGETVHVVTRSSRRAQEFAADGLHPVVADIVSPDSIFLFPEADTILFSVGFDRGSNQKIQNVYVDGLMSVLDRLPTGVQRFIYVSSTGVYGQTDGEWVDEESLCQPEREGGRACLAAEQLLASHPIGGRANILRLAGIYGPGRIPRRKDLVDGKPIAAPGSGYLNLIHVDDAADVVFAVEQSAPMPRTYLVSDGHPVERHEYYRELTSLLGLPAPRFVEPSANAPAAQRAASDKRISNRRLIDELGYKLQYPLYREGLAAIIAEEETRPNS